MASSVAAICAVHRHRVVARDHERLVAVAAQQVIELGLGLPRQQRRVRRSCSR
jgi:hypothetical protein